MDNWVSIQYEAISNRPIAHLGFRYRINGKAYTQEAKVSPFSLVQQQPGEFTITSVAHQQKMCKAAVTDLRFTVHPLPAARVGHGNRIYEDIHEGMLLPLLL